MKGVDELVMEQRPLSAAIIDEAAASTVKSILFYVHQDDGLESRLQAALSLARACSAHLHLLNVVPVEAYTVVDAFASYVSAEIVETLQNEAAKIQARLEDQLKKEDVSWSYEDTTSAAIPELLKHAVFSDLIFIGRQPPYREFNRTGPSLVGELVCSTRTPLCIPGDGVESFDPFGKAVVAWNGSPEGANAVRSTIGLLRMASEVRVVRFTEEKDFRPFEHARA